MLRFTWLLIAYDTVFYAIIAVGHRVFTKLARATRFESTIIRYVHVRECDVHDAPKSDFEL